MKEQLEVLSQKDLEDWVLWSNNSRSDGQIHIATPWAPDGDSSYDFTITCKVAWSWKSLSTVLEVVSAWKGMEKWLMIPSGCRKTQNADTVSLFLGRPSSRLTGAADSNVPEEYRRRINLIKEFCLVLTMLGDVELCHFRFVVRTPNLRKLAEFKKISLHCTAL